MTLTVLDLFSGIGGFSLGLERTGGFRTVAFCEQNAYATAVLNRHWPGVPVFSDVCGVRADTLRAAGIPAIDVVCGGFPCQDISLAGHGAGLDGARSGLWFEMLRIIAETRPRFVIAENVAALRSRGLGTVIRGLSEIGYDAEWHCIPASAVGAPHRRDRVWIIAYPNGQRVRGGGCAEAFGTSGSGESEAQQWQRIRPDADAARQGADVAHPNDGGRDDHQRHSASEPGGHGTENRISGAHGALANANGQPGHEWRANLAIQGAGGRDADRGDISADGMADALRVGLEGSEPVNPPTMRRRFTHAGSSGFAPHPHGAGLEIGHGVIGDDGPKLTAVIRDDWWAVEPDVGRVANGVPSRVDRLRCLGNAVVPQIPEMIGRAILSHVQRVSETETDA